MIDEAKEESIWHGIRGQGVIGKAMVVHTAIIMDRIPNVSGKTPLSEQMISVSPWK